MKTLLFLWTLLAVSTALAADQTVFDYARNGGFAGFSDTLNVKADFRFSISDGRKTASGKLDAAQQVELKKRLAGPSITHEVSDGPRVADGMSEKVRLVGAAQGKATDEQKKAALAHARKLHGALSKTLREKGK